MPVSQPPRQRRDPRASLIYAAEALERRTKPWGRPSGALGQTGLSVLRCLLFRFGSSPAPSYKAIQRGTGFCIETIAQALRRLEAAGVLLIERRSRKTLLGARRITNRYRFLSLILPAREPEIPLVSKKRANFVPYQDLDGPLKEALERLGEKVRAAAGLPAG